MQRPKLHIVSFDVPYPADYGGAIDVFYKIKHLSEAGCEIYLHCFKYGREHAPLLEDFCKEVWYYPRETGIKGISIKLPYIVYSRKNELLLQRLIEIDAPILFEGVHTTYYLNHPALKDRFKIIRTHNIEHDYYHQLYLKENSFFRKNYFKAESVLLRKYEAGFSNAQAFFALSQKDKEYFETVYPKAQHEFIAPFHPFDASDIPTGNGQYVLYHGNLAHPENEEAALFLLRKVIPFVQTKCIIAGKSPSEKILAYARAIDNCDVIVNPDQNTMDELIRDAHIHVLPTFQASGMKLKLLYALFNGRHVVANTTMLHGTALNEPCFIANNCEEMIEAINSISGKPFTPESKAKRAELLNYQYNNKKNADRIIRYLLQTSP